MEQPDMSFSVLEPWVWWTMLSAVLTAATAIFAKRGLKDIDPDLAQLVSTVVVLMVMAVVAGASGKWRGLPAIDRRAAWFLFFSGLTMGLSWVCYFRGLKVGDASRVATVDKLSVVLVAIFGLAFLGDQLGMKGWIGVALVAAGIVLVSMPK
jgi:transporter family protein